jgi:hypothetical protein
MQTVTLQLPETLVQRFQLMANLSHKPLEEVMLQTIHGNLPPAFHELPPELQAELATWVTLRDETLWQLAQETLPTAHLRRQQQLLQKNASGVLSEQERQELGQLRSTTDRFVLRRSTLLALLKWRGYTLPLAVPLAAMSHGATH